MEEVWAIRIEEPIEHLHRAQESFVRPDVEAAAAELRTAAGILAVDAGGLGGRAKAAVEDAAVALRRLAGEVEHGAVVSVERLDRGLGHTHLALETFFIAVAVAIG